MSVLNKLATALNRRDEVPNQELAREIVRERNTAGVRELVENLAHQNKGIQGDCIKMLYERTILSLILRHARIDVIRPGSDPAHQVAQLAGKA